MDFKETQEEEVQVLASIFEGDESFKAISDTCYQYICKEEGKEDGRSFIVEVSWPEMYPEVLPNINLEVFYNNRLPKTLKEDIKAQLLEQAEAFKGEPMTYSLFDWIRENSQQFIEQITDTVVDQVKEEKQVTETNICSEGKVKKEKKEQLSKAQKRKLADQLNSKGEKDRGWNWVDVVKHLSQTGSQSQSFT